MLKDGVRTISMLFLLAECLAEKYNVGSCLRRQNSKSEVKTDTNNNIAFQLNLYEIQTVFT